MSGVERLSIYRLGRHNLGPGKQFQQICWPGKSPGPISLGHLDKVYHIISPIDRFSMLSPAEQTIKLVSFNYKIQLHEAIYIS